MDQKERVVQPRSSTTHKERFYHLRHIPGQSRFSAVTIFAREEKEGWFMTAAFCSAQDQFDRRIGRQTARRRYFARKGNVIFLGKEIKYDTVVSKALLKMADALVG